MVHWMIIWNGARKEAKNRINLIQVDLIYESNPNFTEEFTLPQHSLEKV